MDFNFKGLPALIKRFPDDASAREYFEMLRWNGKPVCPYCDSEKTYKLKDGRRYKCGNSKCYKIFTVTVGTIFESSHIPLHTWFAAAYLISSHKKGISSYQLAKDLAVTQKTGWFMLHRIREMMRDKEQKPLRNIVEIDEVWYGGKVGNMSKKKRTELRKTGMSMKTKTMIVGMVEREGDLKLIPMGKNASFKELEPIIKNNVSEDAIIITDSAAAYIGLDEHFTGHESVNHDQQEYVRDRTHTNTIEGAFSHFKRSIYGVYHQISTKHLAKYCNETMHRYNLRKMSDGERFTYCLSKATGNMSWKNLVVKTEGDGKDVIKAYPMMSIRKANKPFILQVTPEGEVVGQYSTIKSASDYTGFDAGSIGKVLRGQYGQTVGGYYWRYEE